MEIKDLRIFIAVADTAAFRRAATRLGIQQSVVSKRVRDLEEELGISLFERHQSGVTLTHAGEQFDSDIRPLVSQLDKRREEFAQLAKPKRAVCELACLGRFLLDFHVFWWSAGGGSIRW